eukprot:Skav206854  [mRNA]  locus=scaffold1667:126684:132138:+ [translate_table: standard]
MLAELEAFTRPGSEQLTGWIASELVSGRWWIDQQQAKSVGEAPKVEVPEGGILLATQNESEKSDGAEKGEEDEEHWMGSDDELMRLAKDCGEDYDEIDLSKNNLTSAKEILEICKKSPDLKVLKLFNNQLGDEAAEELGEIFKHCHSIEEVHLSHNNFSETAVEVVVKAADRELPTGAERPLWLRMEHNKFQNSENLAREIERQFPAVCAREDRARCHPRMCHLGKRIHLPFLIEVPKGKGRGKDRSRGPRPLPGDRRRHNSRPRRRSRRRSPAPRRAPSPSPSEASEEPSASPEPSEPSPPKLLDLRKMPSEVTKLRPKARPKVRAVRAVPPKADDEYSYYSDYEYEYSYA